MSGLDLPRRRLSPPVRVSLLYAIFGFAWIWLGDLRMLNAGTISPTAWLLSVAKGLLFVAGSALLIYVLVRREEAARDRAEHTRREMHRLEAATHLAGRVSHEFNNILTAIVGHASLLADQLAGDERRDHAEAVQQAAGRATDLTRQLLLFSGDSVTNARMLDVGAMVADTAPGLERGAGPAVRLELRLAPELWPIRTDPLQFQQLLQNLTANAREAMPQGGTLVIEARNVRLQGADEPLDVPLGDYVLLRLADSGSGMTAHTLERAFEPFFSTRREAAGLGLATVNNIVRQAGGHIRVASRPGEGAVFDIFWPRAEAAAPERPTAPVAPCSATVLVVEDDHAVRELAVRILRRHGHTVFAASRGDEALALLEQQPQVQLVVADIVMPGMTGLELGVQLRARRPDVPILFTSGFAAGSFHDASELEPGSHFLEKPFRPDELVAMVDRLLVAGAAEVTDRG